MSMRIVDLRYADISAFVLHCADSVILTHDNRLLLQYRPPNWRSLPDVVSLFGGHVEAGETVMQGLVRELAEELGAKVNPADVIQLGAVSEDFTKHKELVHLYFWHDKNQTITGCYEAEARFYATVEEALQQPNLMEYSAWALREAKRRNLIQ